MSESRWASGLIDAQDQIVALAARYRVPAISRSRASDITENAGWDREILATDNGALIGERIEPYFLLYFVAIC
jgi:hypothetical protein